MCRGIIVSVFFIFLNGPSSLWAVPTLGKVILNFIRKSVESVSSMVSASLLPQVLTQTSLGDGGNLRVVS